MLTSINTSFCMALLVVLPLGCCSPTVEVARDDRACSRGPSTRPIPRQLWSTPDAVTAGDALWREEGVYPSLQDTRSPYVLIVYIDHRKPRPADGSWPARGRVVIDTSLNKVVNVWGDYREDEIDHLNSIANEGVIRAEEAIELAFQYATRGAKDPSKFKPSRRQIDLVGGRYWVIYFPVQLPKGRIGPGYRVRVTVDGVERKALGLTLG